MTYERTVAAALAETKSKFKLAEALADDIPPQQGRRNDLDDGEKSVEEHLADARQEIIDAGGEVRNVKTLGNYRNTALWTSPANGRSYRWVDGFSFTAHSDARDAGMTYDDFAANPKTAREIRTARGGKTAQEEIVASWSPEQKAVAARELLDDPDVDTEELLTKRAIDRQSEPTRPQTSRRPDRSFDTPSWDALEEVLTASHAMRKAVKAATSRDPGLLTDDVRETVAGSLGKIRMACDYLDEILAGDDLSDRKIHEWLESAA